MTTHCVDCGRELYRMSVPPHQRPEGSVKHAGLGRCTRDLRLHREQVSATSTRQRGPVPQYGAAARSLDEYMRGRARRLAEQRAREQRIAAARAAGLIDGAAA